MILQQKPSCLEGSLGAHWPFAEHDGDGPPESAAASSHWYQDSGTPLGTSQTLWLGPDIQLVGWQDSYHPLSSNNSLAVVGSRTSPQLASVPLQGFGCSGPVEGCPWKSCVWGPALSSRTPAPGPGVALEIPVSPEALVVSTVSPAPLQLVPPHLHSDLTFEHCLVGWQGRKGGPILPFADGLQGGEKSFCEHTARTSHHLSECFQGSLLSFFWVFPFPPNSLTEQLVGIVSGHTACHWLMINKEKCLHSGY